MLVKSRYRSGRRGSTLVLFTLMLPTILIPLVGLGIDATMCYIVQAKLGAAVDGAALGAGRLLGTAAVPAEIAGEFLTANFRANGTTAGFWGANTLVRTITYTPGITKTIKIDVNVRVPLLFARLFGQNYATVSATATSARTDSRIMVVLDRSGSMSGSAVTAMIAKATAFTQSFTPGTDQVGLVVYSGSAIVAYPNTRPWTATIGVTGGPDTNFAQTATPANNMLTQIGYIHSGGYTGTADALSLAYIELQKAHMRDSGGAADPRLNSVVFMTDGVPTAVSLYANNPADNVVKASSTCTYEADPAPTANHQMRGWTSSFNSNSHEFSRMMSTDPDGGNTVREYLEQGTLDYARPYSGGGASAWNAANYPLANCTANPWSNSRFLRENSDLARFPNFDLYGNSMTGNRYINSHFVDDSGATMTPNPTYNGTALNLNMAAWTSDNISDYHFGLAAWNAADSAALRIRTDSNQASRGGVFMPITVYAIGYLGSGGLDDGLLKRIANDTTSSSYVASQGTGLYIPATDSAELDEAFSKVAGMILRLSR